MKLHTGIAAVAMFATVALSVLPSFAATATIYAANGRGQIGYSIGIAGAAGDNTAMGRCGGSSAGCKVVMRTQGDCMAAASSSTSKGYWYYIGSTLAQNAYARQSEIRRVEAMVMNWCNGSPAPKGSCKVVHSTCAGYITNLN